MKQLFNALANYAYAEYEQLSPIEKREYTAIHDLVSAAEGDFQNLLIDYCKGHMITIISEKYDVPVDDLNELLLAFVDGVRAAIYAEVEV